MWQPKLMLLGKRNTKSITELESWGLSMNLVGPGLEKEDSSNPKLLAKVRRLSV